MQARLLPAARGPGWLAAGLRLYRGSPLLLTSLTLGYLLLVLAINLIPVIGPFLLPFALPLLAVMTANGCRSLERNQGLLPSTLASGLRENRIALLRLGGLHLLATLAILAISLAFNDAHTVLTTANSGKANKADDAAVLWAMLRLLALAMPVLLAFWFAPLLTAWNGVSALKSVFFSCVASLRNWRAFACYGLTVILIGIILPGLVLVVASLISKSLVEVLSIALRMALMFVLAPVLMASVYLSYCDVFGGDERS